MTDGEVSTELLSNRHVSKPLLSRINFCLTFR